MATGRPRGRRPRAAAPANARRRSIIAEHVDAEPKPGSIGVSWRAKGGRIEPLLSVGSGQADATSPAALPLASDWPGGLRGRISSVPLGRSRGSRHRRGSRPGFGQRSRGVRRRRPGRDGAREPDDVVGARRDHGPVRLTGRRGERRLARVAPAGEGGLGDDRPRRPVSRTRS